MLKINVYHVTSVVLGKYHSTYQKKYTCLIFRVINNITKIIYIYYVKNKCIIANNSSTKHIL